MTTNQAPKGTVLTDAQKLIADLQEAMKEAEPYHTAMIPKSIVEAVIPLLSAQPASAPLQDEDAKDAEFGGFSPEEVISHLRECGKRDREEIMYLNADIAILKDGLSSMCSTLRKIRSFAPRDESVASHSPLLDRIQDEVIATLKNNSVSAALSKLNDAAIQAQGAKQI